MVNIINRIIEIDTIAQQRLDEAHKLKEAVKVQVLEKAEQTSTLISEKADMRISRIEEIETQYAKDKMDKIKAENQQSLSRLEENYNKNHEQFEKEILDNIIKA